MQTAILALEARFEASEAALDYAEAAQALERAIEAWQQDPGNLWWVYEVSKRSKALHDLMLRAAL